MKIYEIGTGYTSIPAKMGAATEIVIEELSKSMIKQNINVQIIDIKDNNRLSTQIPIIEVDMPKKLISTDEKLGLIHKLKRVIYSLKLTKKLKKIIKQSDEEIWLHFHNQYNLFFFYNLTSKKIKKKIKIGYTLHSYIWQGEWNNIKKTIKKRYFQEIKCFKYADKIFVLNDKTIDNLKSHLNVDARKLSFIDNGVNTEIYSPLNIDEKNKLKKKLNIKFEKVFFQVGSVCDRKNQLETIKQLTQMLINNPNYCYLYAGGIIDLEYQHQIEEYIKNNKLEKQVIYIGELAPGEELGQYYKIADCTICLSKLESFGLVIIESMSCGTPVIIPNNLKKLFNRGCIVLDDNKNLQSVIEKEIIDINNWKTHSLESREAILERYSWDVVAKKYYEYMMKGE